MANGFGHRLIDKHPTEQLGWVFFLCPFGRTSSNWACCSITIELDQ